MKLRRKTIVPFLGHPEGYRQIAQTEKLKYVIGL